MGSTLDDLMPKLPNNQWNVDQLGREGDLDERTAKAFYAIDAGNGPEAEKRVLIWLYHNCHLEELTNAEAAADELPITPGRWRVTVVWDARPW
ncbi:hypothetical protein [Nonomuraea sp. NPDC052265]|uniref:hypothetical protein n=1 Tax=Nonomuraea sp. NPDC052265 TaxID=3364374 RepID=UPI0037CA6EC8